MTNTAQVWIDGTDVTNLAIAGSSTRRLNRMSQAQVTLPMDAAIGGVGSLLKIAFNGDLHHHGIVMLCETSAGENDGSTVYNSRDPVDIWSWRPVRDDDGDYTKPTEVIETWGPIGAPSLLQVILTNSETAFTGAAGDPTPDGPLLLEFGDFESGGTDVSGAPTDWPMTIADFVSLLTATGQLDFVITPIDSGGNLGRIDAYNGNYGTDHTGDVIFQYGMGNYSIREIRVNDDATNVVSKLRYLLGPRVLRSFDPKGDQHWKTSIGPGTTFPDFCDVDLRFEDIANTYGGRFDIKIYDGDNVSDALELWRLLYGWEACLRTVPRRLVHITPTRETEIFTFDIGDLVTVQAAPIVVGGFSGAQRVYEYTISWDEDSVLALSELVTSPDQEGFSE